MTRFDYSTQSTPELRAKLLEALTGNAAYSDEGAEEALDEYVTRFSGEWRCACNSAPDHAGWCPARQKA